VTPVPAPTWTRAAVLRDGTEVRLRSIRHEDAAALTSLYDRLSPETAYQRFFTVMRRLPPDWAQILADVDYDRKMAIGAVGADGGLVAVARYSYDPAASEAEIALVVQDGWQGKGLGTILLRELLAYAEERGIRRFRAYVLADNRRMFRLVSEQGRITEQRLDQGVISVGFTRAPDPAGRPPASEWRGR
jgi:RimJ/RimL family protein N-acetyltransferase